MNKYPMFEDSNGDVWVRGDYWSSWECLGHKGLESLEIRDDWKPITLTTANILEWHYIKPDLNQLKEDDFCLFVVDYTKNGPLSTMRAVRVWYAREHWNHEKSAWFPIADSINKFISKSLPAICPNCYVSPKIVDKVGLSATLYSVECPLCGRRSSSCISADWAIDRWNKEVDKISGME